MVRVIAVLWFLIISMMELCAQNFGGFPTSTKWRQINTDTSRIIFTSAAGAEAQRVATIVNAMAAKSNPLGTQFKKINIVLQNNTTLTNGYVALGPFRSEFYLIPGGNIFEFGNLPWQEQLAIHEYRHVQQYNNFNRGLSKGLGILFGQEGRAVANALAVPDWFFEGDAVYAETILTSQGRGRTPYFHNGYKSIWREGRSYNWMKLRNGSFKDYVPNHYQLGYLLVNYGYLKYGEDFWRKVTADASSFKGVFYPFQQAVKRQSGVEFKTFRKEALQFYNHEVSKRRSDQVKPETVTNFYFPQQIGSDSVLYLKDSYKSIPAFYIKTTGGEKRIKQKNIGSEEWFSYRNGLIAYTAYSTHSRWSLIDYSDIVLLNVHTGKEEKLTQRSKYFTPDIAPDQNSLAAVFVTDSITSELHILDLQGKIKNKFKAPAQSFFIQPRFIDLQTVVVGVRWPNALISLEILNLNNGQLQNLVPRSTTTIGNPFVHNNEVYFTSSLTGNDEVYTVRTKDKKVFQLTNGASGKYFITATNDSLRYSAFTGNGFREQVLSLKDVNKSEVNPIMWNETMLPFPLAGVEKMNNILSVTSRNFPVSEYKKSTGLFNFHSWRPDYEEPEITFSIFSDNILNTFSNQLFYRYNRNERSHTGGLSLLYGGWYPMIRAGVEHTNSRHLRRTNDVITLNQTEANIGYFIPLNFTHGKTFKFLNFGSSYFISDVRPTGASKNRYTPFQSNYLSHSLSFSQQLPRARQHIFPKLGYAISNNYRHRLDEYGYQALSNGQVFLPSVFKTHSIVFSGSFQQTDTGNVLFSNRFINSRGYDELNFSRMWRASANYHMPLVYPDFGIANLIYLQRVRSNFFYDYSRIFSNDKRNTVNLRSAGAEMFFDTRWLNALPLTFRLRYSHRLDADLLRLPKKGLVEFDLLFDLIPD